MKSSRRDYGLSGGTNQQNKKYGKSSGDKWTSRKLDRKSSRGMIYENEELRLRTININAEVERGQSDIRKLRRENEQLKREIWTLRDEYDKLHRLLRPTRNSSENIGDNDLHSGSQTEDSDSCDTCKENDADDDFLDEKSKDYSSDKLTEANSSGSSSNQLIVETGNSSSCANSNNTKFRPPLPPRRSSISGSGGGSQQQQDNFENSSNNSNTKQIHQVPNDSINMQLQQQQQHNKQGDEEKLNNYDIDCVDDLSTKRDDLHVNFDHLSIVSEENLTNSDGNSVQHIDEYLGNGIDASDSQIYMYSNQMGYLPSYSPMSPQMLQQQQQQQQQQKFPNYNNYPQQNLIRGTTLPQPQVQQQQQHLQPFDMNTIAVGLTDLNSPSIVPPLSHFESIVDEQFGKNLDDINCSTASTTATDETVIPANGCDFDFQSPFTKRKINNNSIDGSTIKHEQQTTSPNYDSSGKTPDDSKPTVRSPKHFFSPIKPHPISEIVAIQTSPPHQRSNSIKSSPSKCGPPDICVANVLGSGPTTVTVTSESTAPGGVNQFQNGGNLDDLLMDIENLTQDLENEQKQLKTFTGGKINALSETLEKTENQKPYRSEMNLVLNYDGSGPVITSLPKSTTSEKISNTLTTGTVGTTESTMTVQSYNTNSINQINSDRENSLVETSSGGGTLPEPMVLFPPNLPYLGFENYGLPESLLPTQQQQPMENFPPAFPEPPIVPIPPPPQFPPPPSATTAAMQQQEIYYKQDTNATSTTKTTATSPMTPPIRSPAMMKRKMFLKRSDDDQTTQSFNGSDETHELILRDRPAALPISPLATITTSKVPTTTTTTTSTTTSQSGKSSGKSKFFRAESSASETFNCESSSGSETAKKGKPRRVSILNFRNNNNNSNNNNNDKKNLLDDSNETEKQRNRRTEENTISNKITNPIEKSSSVQDLNGPTVITNESVNITTITTEDQKKQQPPQSSSNWTTGRERKASVGSILNSYQQQIHSTPNSPHSASRRSSSANVHNNHSHHHHHHHHHTNRKLSRESSRSASGTSFAAIAGTPISSVVGGIATLTTIQSSRNSNKNSRRHSEGTVISMHHGAGSSAAGGVIGGGHHHHHNHHNYNHHRQDSTISNLHDSHHDLGGAGTSISERNSNSLASSRESSTSLSLRSTRRKISNASHTGGKIPWCGCWGNGCL